MAGSTLQTEGQKQFRLNRQVLIVLGAMMIALALPLGGVILTLQSIAGRRAQEPVQIASEGLQTMLEGIADHRLAPPQLSGSAIRIEVAAEELRPQKERIERLLSPTGGIAVPTESESEIRLLIRIPDEHLQEFLRAVQNKESKQMLESGGLLEVVLARTGLE
jgi:hypothetical protein